MTSDDGGGWTPFRPDAEDLKAIDGDVAEVTAIQRTLVEKHGDLRCPDRVAHQYQIAGSPVTFDVAQALPEPLAGVGLFQPGARHRGIGRVSTGLGTPHAETLPDFLGVLLAFETAGGHRVDFLFINDPTSPTDNHRDFVSVLHATGESAGAGHFISQQTAFIDALKDRMGWVHAGATMAHLTRQTLRTTFSGTAYQAYWSGIAEVCATAGKFTLVPTSDDNRHPGLHAGERHLTEEWQARQRAGAIEFSLYWIPFLDEARTPTVTLTAPWDEAHRQLVGRVTFPRSDAESDEAMLWAILASEMGGNPGHWVHDREHSISEPADAFGVARKMAYQKSQDGRGALPPGLYRSVFTTGEIDQALAEELKKRASGKERAGHVNRRLRPAP